MSPQLIWTSNWSQTAGPLDTYKDAGKGGNGTHLSIGPGAAIPTAASDLGRLVPSSGPYTLTAQQPHYAGDVYVLYTNTEYLFQKVPSSPVQGQYSVNINTGVYTFSSADAGASVNLYYTITNSGTLDVPKGTWIVPLQLALCQGPIDGILSVWDGATPLGSYTTLAYFVDKFLTTPNAWAANTHYNVGDQVVHVGNAYVCTTAGTSTVGGTGPTITGDGIADGTVVWAYVTSQFTVSFMSGSNAQPLWPGWWELPTGRYSGTTPPGPALMQYKGIAYIATAYADCGSGDIPVVPQHAFECIRFPGGVSRANVNGDYLLSYCLEDLLTNVNYGIGLSNAWIDSTTLSTWESYMTQQGLYYSPLLKGQDKVIDIIDRWAQLSNTWIYYSGTAIMFCPLADAAVGSFTPDTTPAYNLGVGDFLDHDHPVTVERQDPEDCYNRVTVQIADRLNGYAANPIEYKDQGLIDQYGVLDASSVSGEDICDAYVGAVVANFIGQRLSYIRNVYSFKLSYRYIRLLPGSIVTLTEPNIGISGVVVRIRSIEEDENFQLSVVAEEMPGTTGIATSGGATPGTSAGTPPAAINQNVAPGNINTPAIIEPTATTAPLLSALGVAQVWLVASGGPNWGGAEVYFSADNVTYTPIGSITNGAQALLTASLPSHADPDTTNTLAVDYTESMTGPNVPVTNADADAGRTLCVIAGPPTGTDPLVMPSTWELLSYGAESNTGSFAYNLTYLRRGQYGSTIAAHSTGDTLSGLSSTVLEWNLQAQYVGVTVYFKFLSYNTYGNAQQQLSDVPAYQYTPTGVGFGGGTGGVPTVPTGLTATGGAGQIALSWSPNPSTDNVTSYTLYAAPGASQPFSSASPIFTGLATMFVQTGLGNGVSETYFVVATNSVGSSTHTAGVTGTTSSSGGAGGCCNLIIYQPGGTALGNVYTTWATAYAAASAITGDLEIFFDPKFLAHPYIFTIPAGSYTFAQSKCVFSSVGCVDPGVNDNVLGELHLATGVTLSGITEFRDIWVVNQSTTTTPVTYATAGYFGLGLTGVYGARLSASNSSFPCVVVNNTTSSALAITMRGASAIGDTTNISGVGTTGAGTGLVLTIEMDDASFISNVTPLALAHTSNALVVVRSPAANASGVPAGVTITYADANIGAVAVTNTPTVANEILVSSSATAAAWSSTALLPAIGTEGQFLVVNATPAPAYVSISGDIDASTTTPGELFVKSISYDGSAGGGAVDINGTGTSIVWAANNTGPSISQAQSTTGAGVATSLSAQSAKAGSNGHGGAYLIQAGAGDGSGATGFVALASGNLLAGLILGNTSSDTLTMGLHPAASGMIQLPNAVSISWRNAASSGDIAGIAVDSSNYLNLGGSAAAIQFEVASVQWPSSISTPALQQAQASGTGGANGSAMYVISQPGQNGGTVGGHGGPLMLTGGAGGNGSTTNGTGGNVVAAPGSPGAGAGSAGEYGFFEVQPSGAFTAWSLGFLGGSTAGGDSALYGNVTPSTTNYSLATDSSTEVVLNAPANGTTYLSVGGSQLLWIGGSGGIGVTWQNVTLTNVNVTISGFYPAIRFSGAASNLFTITFPDISAVWCVFVTATLTSCVISIAAGGAAVQWLHSTPAVGAVIFITDGAGHIYPSYSN